MRSVRWNSDSGLSVEFTTAPPFLFSSLQDALGATAQTNKTPNQDGKSTVKVLRDGYTVNLVGHIIPEIRPGVTDARMADIMIEEVKAAFDPKLFGTLIYRLSHKTIQLRCRPIASPSVTYLIDDCVKVDIDLEADTDRWESVEIHSAGMGYSRAMWVFPWHIPGPMGIRYGEAIIDNPTAYDITPIIEVFKTPTLVEISNQVTGEALTIRYPIGDNQKMVVDIARKRAELFELQGEDYVLIKDVTNWLVLGSSWLVLVPGKNHLMINKDIPAVTPVTIVRYRLPSAGV